jgi:hypothetical protein
VAENATVSDESPCVPSVCFATLAAMTIPSSEVHEALVANRCKRCCKCKCCNRCRCGGPVPALFHDLIVYGVATFAMILADVVLAN